MRLADTPTGVAAATASYDVVETHVCGLIGQLAGGPHAEPILPTIGSPHD